MVLEDDNLHWIGAIHLLNGQKDFLIFLDKQWQMMELFGWVLMISYSPLELCTFVEYLIKIFGNESDLFQANGKVKQQLVYQQKNFQQLNYQKTLITE